MEKSKNKLIKISTFIVVASIMVVSIGCNKQSSSTLTASELTPYTPTNRNGSPATLEIPSYHGKSLKIKGKEQYITLLSAYNGSKRTHVEISYDCEGERMVLRPDDASPIGLQSTNCTNSVIGIVSEDHDAMVTFDTQEGKVGVIKKSGNGLMITLSSPNESFEAEDGSDWFFKTYA